VATNQNEDSYLHALVLDSRLQDKVVTAITTGASAITAATTTSAIAV
jgi:hypothetical protein